MSKRLYEINDILLTKIITDMNFQIFLGINRSAETNFRISLIISCSLCSPYYVNLSAYSQTIES